MTQVTDTDIKKLREDLRNGRQDNHTTGGGTEPTGSNTVGDSQFHAASVDTTPGHSVQSVSGPSAGAKSELGQSDNTGRKPRGRPRSTASSNIGLGSTTRRLSENNGQSRADGATVSTSPGRHSTEPVRNEVGNLVSIEPTPTRFFEPISPYTKRGQEIAERGGINTIGETKTGKGKTSPDAGPSTKSGTGGKGLSALLKEKVEERRAQKELEPKSEKKSLFRGAGKVLTPQEAKLLTEPFLAAIVDNLEHVDELLWGIGDDPTKRPIWSDIDQEEAETIARLFLKRAQHNVAAAVFVRSMVDIADYITAGMIVLPRLKRTVDIIRERPRPEKRKSRAA